MQKENKIFLLTGGNIEPRRIFLEKINIEVDKCIGKIIAKSSIYESEPWGFSAEIPFLNQVIVVMTELSPINVLKEINLIEEKFGRLRDGENYISRTVDIDILYFENYVIETKELTIPHPRLHERKFTLLPLVEIAAEYMHPVLRKSNQELMESSGDLSGVWKLLD